MTRSAPARSTLSGTRPSGAQDEAAAARQVREMFGHIAPRYDLLNHLLSLRIDVLWRRRVARRFRSITTHPDARVLDLCCGTGDLALTIADQAGPSGARVIGVDFAHPMLVRAREKAARTLIEFLEGDALDLPFAGETMDLVTTAFGFRNLANYASGLSELRRILRPGGSVAILEFAEPESTVFGRLYQLYFHKVLPRIGALFSGNGHAYSYLPSSVARFPRPAQLAELMRSAGFSEVGYERWTGGIVALHTGRR